MFYPNILYVLCSKQVDPYNEPLPWFMINISCYIPWEPSVITCVLNMWCIGNWLLLTQAEYPVQWCSQSFTVGRAQSGPLTVLIGYFNVILEYFSYFCTNNIWVDLGPAWPALGYAHDPTCLIKELQIHLLNLDNVKCGCIITILRSF